MPNYIIRIKLITDIRPKNEGGAMGGGGGGMDAVDERYVTLGGCTVQRNEALQGGGGGGGGRGCQVFRKKALRNT